MIPNWPSLEDLLIHLISALLLLSTGLRLLLSDWSHLLGIYRDWRLESKEENPIVNTSEIIGDLKNERNRIDQAIQALEGSSGRRGGRSRSGGNNGYGNSRRRRRGMSAAARKKISLAQKKRWAKLKKKAA